MTIALPHPLQTVFEQHRTPTAVFEAVLPALCEVLNCDRCFLYVRNPQTGACKVAFCWRRSSEIPDVTDADWRTEPDSLADDDPLYAASLRCAPSVYVEDVETASPDVVNIEFEHQYFGHRALIHSHLCKDGQMWGILQPCVFGEPRQWSAFDRAIITQLEEMLTPLAIAYVQAAGV